MPPLSISILKNCTGTAWASIKRMPSHRQAQPKIQDGGEKDDQQNPENSRTFSFRKPQRNHFHHPDHENPAEQFKAVQGRIEALVMEKEQRTCDDDEYVKQP